MKNLLMVKTVCLLCLGLNIVLTGCATTTGTGHTGQLNVPANLSISVDHRLMTISWDAVENAVGYIIQTTSENCGSGNRIINTATRQAWNTDTGAIIPYSNIYLSMDEFELDIEDRKAMMPGGPIIFINDTTIAIWLMSESMELLDEPMPTSLTARISAAAFVQYGHSTGARLDFAESGYSPLVSLNKANYN